MFKQFRLWFSESNIPMTLIKSKKRVADHGEVFVFRRYEDASLCYTGIESHEGLRHYGLYDTVVAKDWEDGDL